MTVTTLNLAVKRAQEAGVVDILRDYLAQAERGELISVAIVGKRPEGNYTTGSSSCDSSSEMAGMLLAMAMRRLNLFVELP